jgi:hypothetical protein
MKILLISNGRTGSYSICEWLSKELNIKFITEIDNFLDYKVEDNFILKRTLSNNDFDLEDIKHFDKIIVLYRKNTLKQSESNLYAILKNKWHHYSDDITDGYYEIDEDFFIKNHETIWNSKYQLDEEKNVMLNLKFGIKVSYEEIFEEEVGEKIISNYLDFSPKIKLNTKLKMRKESPQQYAINSYEREYKRLLIRIEGLENENKELKTLIDLMKKTSNKLI